MSQRPGPRPGTAGGLGVRRRCRCEAQGGCGYRWRWRGWLTVYGVALRGGGPATPCLLPRARTPAHQARSLCHTRTALRQVHVCASNTRFWSLLCVTHFVVCLIFLLYSACICRTRLTRTGEEMGERTRSRIAGASACGLRVRRPRGRGRCRWGVDRGWSLSSHLAVDTVPSRPRGARSSSSVGVAVAPEKDPCNTYAR